MAGRTLTVYLAADTTGFRRGMTQAGDAVDGPTGFRGRVSGLASSMTNMLGPALIGATAALGAFAVKMAVDGVQAAIDEQAELEKLNTILGSMGFAGAEQAVSDFVDEMARATTFSDSDLRPALGSLVSATGSLEAAQKLLKIAMDASIGSGKSLDTVTGALTKAANGNTGALERMFPWLKSVDGATGNLDVSTAALAERFSGQAATAAATWSGKLGNAAEAFDELKESFGAGFLEGLGTAEDQVGDMSTALYDLQQPVKDIGREIGKTLTTIGEYVQLYVDARDAVEEFRVKIADTPWAKVFDAFTTTVDRMVNPLKTALGVVLSLIDAMKALAGVGTPNVTPGGAGNWPGTNPNGPGAPGSENGTRSLTPTVAMTTVLSDMLVKGDARGGRLANGGVLR